MNTAVAPRQIYTPGALPITLPPEYKPDIPPFDHQARAVSKGWARHGYGYLLEMGLGKTRVLIDDFCINYMRGEVSALVVIAPKSVYTNWSRVDDENPGELQKWVWSSVKDGMVMYRYRAGKTKQDVAIRTAAMDGVSPGPRILVINVEAISSTDEAYNTCVDFMKAHPKCMIAVDESTIIKDRSSKRTKSCLKLSKMAKLRRILTGSPSTGSLTDVWAQFEFLEPACLGHRTFASFQARYAVLRDMRIGGRIIKKEVGPQNIEELRDILKKHSYRRRKKDCLDLPEKMYEPRMVELTDEQAAAYNDMRKGAFAMVQGVEVTTNIVVTQLMKLHQIVCGHVTADDGTVIKLKNNRVDAMMEVIETAGDRQAVIWCCYRPDAEAVVTALRLKYGADSVAEWTGAVPQDMREEGEGNFQAGRARFMVATQSAGARGRTWTAATLVIYYSNSYDLELREQSEDRTHRIGQTGTVLYVDMMTSKTIEEKIIKSLREKKNVVRQVLQDGISAWI